MDQRFVRLRPDCNLESSDCADNDLNEFIRRDAKLYQNQLLAVSYVLEVGENTVGFFCVSNDRICKDDTNKWRKIKDSVPHPKRRNSYPAVKIGRLAIDKKFQRDGFGQKMLEYIKYLFLENNKTGCRFLLVDAYSQSVNFYNKNGFIELSNDLPDKDTTLMYFDLNYFRSSVKLAQ